MPKIRASGPAPTHVVNLDMSGKEDPSFRLWCQKELSNHLQLTVDDGLLDYLLAIETEKDLKEYLTDLIGEETSQTGLFIKEFIRHWQLQLETTPFGAGELKEAHYSDGGPTKDGLPSSRQDRVGSVDPASATPPLNTDSMHELERLTREEMVLFVKESKEVGWLQVLCWAEHFSQKATLYTH